MVHPTPYPELNEVLGELVIEVRTLLGETFVAACLQGSFAVGDFDRHSDVDFVIAVELELDADQVKALQTMHGRVYDLDSEWTKHLEGSYFAKRVLARWDQRDKLLWYLDHGHRSLIQSTHCNTAVVRSVLRDHGIGLAGPSPASLVDPIPVSVLRAEILSTIIDWGEQILADPAPFNNRFYQSFIVLNYCRMLHDLHTGRVGSKRAGAEWAKMELRSDWTALIDRAWDGRPDPATSVRQPADPDEFRRTLEFLAHVMDVSREYAASSEWA